MWKIIWRNIKNIWRNISRYSIFWGARPPDHLHLGAVAEQDDSLSVLVTAKSFEFFSFCRRFVFGFFFLVWEQFSRRKTEWSYYRLCPHPPVKPATQTFSSQFMWVFSGTWRGVLFCLSKFIYGVFFVPKIWHQPPVKHTVEKSQTNATHPPVKLA